MKKIYLVKKDVNKPSGEGNWIKMTPYEFAQFMKTPEGQSRKKNFAQLDGCDYNDDIIVAECEEKLAKKIRAEKDAHDYLMSIEKEMGYTVFSYNEQENSEDELTGEELLEDESVDVENETLTNILIEKMREGLKTLSENEIHLLKKMYLDNSPMSAKEYANKYAIPETTIHCRKHSALKKLRRFIKNKK